MQARSHRTLERLEHRMKVPGAIIANAVDEQRRRTGDAVLLGICEIPSDARTDVFTVEVALKTLEVESNRARELDQISCLDRRLTIEETVMHFKEPTLTGRRFRRSRCELRAGVRALVREMSKGVDEPIA